MAYALDDLYKLFEVSHSCSDEELRKSYRKLLLHSHPDVNPASIEDATRKTQQVLAAYGYLTEWRRAHSRSAGEVVEKQEPEVVIETATGVKVSFSSSAFGVSLNRIAALKEELRDAWREFGDRQYDVKAALRLVRAAFQGGRPDVVDALLGNAKLVDAAPILADMYSPDEAAGIALMWAQRLCDSGQLDLAVQLLEDVSGVAGTSSLVASQLRESLRSIHYRIAQGYVSGEQKPSPATRILHLRAIVELGFELGYVYKLLAEAFYEMGDEDKARSTLEHALAIEPQLSGAKTIMRALGLLGEEPARKDRRSERIKHVYTRPEHVPAIATIVGWFEREQWEEIIAHSDPGQYSPGLLPSARRPLGAVASVLGECTDARALPRLIALLESVYWDVRQAALLALAKIGREPELARLRVIGQERGKNDSFVAEAVAYAEARLIGTREAKDDQDVVQAAEALLRTYSYKQYGELGRMRWRLEQAIKSSTDQRATVVLPLVAAYCLQMNDWTRVLKLLAKSSLPSRIGDPQTLDFHIDVAAALVRGGAQSTALGCLHAIYEQLPPDSQRRANAIVWDALNSLEFIGPGHYIWALRIVMMTAVSAGNADDLLRGLHRLARVMEPIGEKDMGLWLRHTLRAEAPGHYYGDSHDRLNYFREPVCDADFVKQVKEVCEEYKAQITDRLRVVLGGDRPIRASIPLLSD